MTQISQFRSTIRRHLNRYGFSEAVSKNLMTARCGRLLVFAYAQKSRWDESAKLIVGAWHSTLAIDDSLSLTDSIKVDSENGDLSHFGVGAGKSWRLDGDPSEVLRCIDAIAIPWMASAPAMDKLSNCPELDSADATLGKVGCFHVPETVERGAFFSTEAWRENAKRSLGPVFAAFQFQMHCSEKQLAFVREREQFVDVIEPVRISNGFHTYFNCFVSTRELWSVRKELKGIFVQTNGGELGSEGLSLGVRCFQNEGLFLGDENASIQAKVFTQALPFFGQIDSRQAFLDRIGFGWESTIGSAMRRAWAR